VACVLRDEHAVGGFCTFLLSAPGPLVLVPISRAPERCSQMLLPDGAGRDGDSEYVRVTTQVEANIANLNSQGDRTTSIALSSP
jgi:hypothetical protein